MADVDLTSFFTQKKREFGTQNQNGGKFDDDFRDAVNYAIGEINLEADLSTTITEISGPTGTVANLDKKYGYVLSVGTTLWLMLIGRRPPRGADKAINAINQKFHDSIQSMATSIRNIATYADTDDETATNIGLGPVGP